MCWSGWGSKCEVIYGSDGKTITDKGEGAWIRAWVGAEEQK